MASTEHWKHFTWVVRPERLELCDRRSSPDPKEDKRVFFMEIPKTEGRSRKELKERADSAAGNFIWAVSAGGDGAYNAGHDIVMPISTHVSGMSAAASVDALDQLMAGLGGTTSSGAADDDSEALFGSLQDDVAIDLLFG